MTEQERQMIETLAKRIQDAPAPQIDRDADDLIRRAIGARSDALYILTQTVLIQEMALTQAKAQIDEPHTRGALVIGRGIAHPDRVLHESEKTPERSGSHRGVDCWGALGFVPRLEVIGAESFA